MSDGGDGFELHPGDPWHPGWTDDAVDESATPPTSSGGSKDKKRRWFRRKPEPRPDVTAEEDIAYSEPLADPQARFRPAVPFVPEPLPLPAVDAEPAGEQPPLELPAWVGEATQGAEVESAGFEPVVPAEPAIAPAAAAPAVEPPPQSAPEPESVPEPEPEPEPAAAAPITPPIAADPPPVVPAEPVVVEQSEDDPFEAVRRLEEAASLERAPEPEPVASEPVAAPTQYGVAGKEAFAALGSDDADDLEDWAAFAGSPDGDPKGPTASTAVVPREPVDALPDAAPDPGALADDVPEDDGKRRGIWPFRRRRRPEVAEEPDYPAIEDVWPEEDVLGPGAWSAPDSRTVPVETPQLWDTEPGDEPIPDPVVGEVADAAEDWDDAPTATTPVAPAGVSPESIAEDLDLPTPADEPHPAAEPQWDDAALAETGEEWRLAFDDGTAEDMFAPSFAPRPAGSTGGDEDAWGSDADWDNESTVEMTDPGLLVPDDVYGMAGTVEHRGLAEEMFRLGEEDTEWQAMTAAMPGVESGVVGFEDVADLTTGEQYEEGPRSDLGARVGVGLLLTVFLVGTMFVGGAAMAVFVGAMALLGTWELFGTLRRLEFQPLAMIGYLGSLGILASVWFHGPIAIPIGLAMLIVVVYFVYAFSPMRQDALANGGLTVLAVAWVAGGVAFATPILRLDDFRALVAALVVATVAMDIGAYSFGRTFGSRALAPFVSPNKSVEGLLGGVLVTVGAGVGFGLLVEPFDMVSGIALGAVVAVMAPLGDLAESMVKRSLGVKDMGTLLPGHGGVLDRIDGFLFVLPAVFVLYRVTGFLG